MPCLQAFTWIEPNLLAAGIYNSVQGVFQGCTVNGVTYLPSTSATQVGYFPAFVQILPVSPPFHLVLLCWQATNCAMLSFLLCSIDSLRGSVFATVTGCTFKASRPGACGAWR